MSTDELVAKSNKYIYIADEINFEILEFSNTNSLKTQETQKHLSNSNKNNMIQNESNLTVEFINETISNKLDSYWSSYLNDNFKTETKRINLLEKKFEIIKSLVIKNASELNLYRNNLRNFESEISELKNISKELENRSEIFRHSCMDLENRVKNLENLSKDGTYVWKIQNIREKINEAKANRLVFLDSSPFYTSINGYKMCVRLYLNGDGSGKGTHMSLYFIIMKSDYDNLLKWPFKQQIKFILLDQSALEPKYHLVESFKPDPNSVSYKKPSGQMNVASGLPLFCSHKNLFENTNSQFIKDNTLFIKIIVDLTNIFVP